MNLLIVLVLTLVLATTAPAVETRGRMFNSMDVQPQQMPSLVRIRMRFGNQGGLCSGTLIGVVWALTAAHCLVYKGKMPNAIVVLMGSNQQGVNESYVPIHPVTADKLIIHENDNLTGNMENDIALLKVENVTLNSYRKIAKLPLLSTSKKLNCFGENGTVAGWGMINDKGSMSSFAQWNIFNVIERAYCEYFYRAEFYDNQLCLYKKYAGICVWDSGGPMYVGDQVAGIASYIPGTGCEGFSHMVFTNVNFFVDWIKEKTNIFY